MVATTSPTTTRCLRPPCTLVAVKVACPCNGTVLGSYLGSITMVPTLASSRAPPPPHGGPMMMPPSPRHAPSPAARGGVLCFRQWVLQCNGDS